MHINWFIIQLFHGFRLNPRVLVHLKQSSFMGNLMNLFTKEPLVSVILPVYNAGDFLIPAVKSIIFQTYQNWELLLIDDCSTDNALLDLQEKLSDPRIKIFRNSSNQGVTARLNQGIDLAKGSFLARMDQDDICVPERLA